MVTYVEDVELRVNAMAAACHDTVEACVVSHDFPGVREVGDGLDHMHDRVPDLLWECA